MVESEGRYIASNAPTGSPKNTVAANCVTTKVLLLTYDCELDKKMPNWLVSPVIPLSKLKGEVQANVRKNKIFHLVYLPKYRDILEESVVVLNQITTLSRVFVESGERVVSLSDIGRRAFYNQHIRWMTRWTLNEISCPRCGVVFDPASTLTVRT